MAFEVFERYRSQVEQDLKFDEYNIKDLTMRLPSLKHFWVGKLVEARINLKRLEDKKKDLIDSLQTKTKPEIGLSKSTMSNIVMNNETIKEINQKIDEYKVIVEYLEKVEKIFHSATFDLKNFIETIKIDEVK